MTVAARRRGQAYKMPPLQGPSQCSRGRAYVAFCCAANGCTNPVSSLGAHEKVERSFWRQTQIVVVSAVRSMRVTCKCARGGKAERSVLRLPLAGQSPLGKGGGICTCCVGVGSFAARTRRVRVFLFMYMFCGCIFVLVQQCRALPRLANPASRALVYDWGTPVLGERSD